MTDAVRQLLGRLRDAGLTPYLTEAGQLAVVPGGAALAPFRDEVVANKDTLRELLARDGIQLARVREIASKGGLPAEYAVMLADAVRGAVFWHLPDHLDRDGFDDHATSLLARAEALAENPPAERGLTKCPHAEPSWGDGPRADDATQGYEWEEEDGEERPVVMDPGVLIRLSRWGDECRRDVLTPVEWREYWRLASQDDALAFGAALPAVLDRWAAEGRCDAGWAGRVRARLGEPKQKPAELPSPPVVPKGAVVVMADKRGRPTKDPAACVLWAWQGGPDWYYADSEPLPGGVGKAEAGEKPASAKPGRKKR